MLLSTGRTRPSLAFFLGAPLVVAHGLLACTVRPVPESPFAGGEPTRGDYSSEGPAGGTFQTHVALGIPTDADPTDDIVLDKHEFVVSYNPRRRAPNWVAWRLDATYLGDVRRRNNFRPDESLPVGVYRVTPADYLRSGYDRGHLCPSADRDATPAMNSTTFLMTNIVPQAHELNAGPWKQLEEGLRHRASAPGFELYIVAGPIFDVHPTTVGNNVPVPSATYKIAVTLRTGEAASDVTGTTEVVAAVMPNRRDVNGRRWSEFVTSVDEIESQTGYDFLDAVPDAVETMIEARVGAVGSSRPSSPVASP